MGFWGTLGAIVNPVAAIGTIGSLGGSLLSYYGQQQTNEQNIALQREQMDRNSLEALKNRNFQEEMSNTAYQRSRADMERAGYNPMMAFQQGGASTPGGSAAAGSPATVENSIGAGMSSAKDFLSTLATIDKLRADAKAADAQATVSVAMADKVKQDTKTSGSSARKMDAEEANLRLQRDVWKKDAAKGRIIGKGYDLVERLVDGVTSGVGSAHKKFLNAERFNMPVGGMKER